MAFVYIAGPMTGQPNFNADVFDRVKGMLHLLGHDPVSPLDLNLASGFVSVAHDGTVQQDAGYSWGAAMAEDIRALVRCDAIALLPGWQKSRGASLEEHIARSLGLRRFYVDLAAGTVQPAMFVGLSGYARSGKDTACDGLVQAGFARVAFADAVRASLAAVNPLVPYGDEMVRVDTLVATYGWEAAKATSEVRALSQRVGTEGGRAIHGEDAWVNVAMRTAGPKTAFSDVRFPNEADAIRSMGGIVIRITRPGVGPANGHTSETALDDYEFDFVVSNDGTVENLQAAVVRLVASWMERKVSALAA
jgi:hypothetical protein